MRRSLRGLGLLLVGSLVAGGLVASCANRSIAGTGGPGAVGSDLPPSTCPPSGATPDDSTVATPIGQPVITITQGTNSWVATDLTQPYAIAIYPDGTAIRAEDEGIGSDPLPDMTIGRLAGCQVQEAAAEIERLAGTDLGEATVTDQGTTTITLHSDGAVLDDADLVLEIYALGVGDELVQPDQRAARQQVSALIDDLTGSMTQTGRWTSDRVRVSATYGTPGEVTGGMTWPRPGTIAAALNQGGGRPCAVFDGADAAAIRAALGTGRAVSGWTDGTQTTVLAVGVLVPGQDCSPT